MEDDLFPMPLETGVAVGIGGNMLFMISYGGMDTFFKVLGSAAYFLIAFGPAIWILWIMFFSIGAWLDNRSWSLLMKRFMLTFAGLIPSMALVFIKSL